MNLRIWPGRSVGVISLPKISCWFHWRKFQKGLGSLCCDSLRRLLKDIGFLGDLACLLSTSQCEGFIICYPYGCESTGPKWFARISLDSDDTTCPRARLISVASTSAPSRLLEDRQVSLGKLQNPERECTCTKCRRSFWVWNFVPASSVTPVLSPEWKEIVDQGQSLHSCLVRPFIPKSVGFAVGPSPIQ